MPESTPSSSTTLQTSGTEGGRIALAGRSLLGGLLMGIANVVPGISGGAMLLLMGVYKAFLDGLADLTSLRWRSLSAWLVVAVVGFGALTSIAFLAGPMKWLLVTYRFEVYSVLIGMRLGVIPTVWHLAGGKRGATRGLWIGMGVGVVLTSLAAIFKYNPDIIGTAGTSPAMLFFGGLIAASATILPGLDGSYLLMLLGQYVPVLGAIDRFKDGVLARDFAAISAELWTLVPFGMGAAIGIAGVAVLLRWLFKKYPAPTIGLLLGVLMGAFIGLYPFASYVQPAVGDVIKGVTITAENLASIDKDDWKLKFYSPTLMQFGISIVLIIAGLVAARLLARLDPEERQVQ
ncbi:MAG: DUF368 domain-containing protein [Phycisphaerales bacterium]